MVEWTRARSDGRYSDVGLSIHVTIIIDNNRGDKDGEKRGLYLVGD